MGTGGFEDELPLEDASGNKALACYFVASNRGMSCMLTSLGDFCVGEHTSFPFLFAHKLFQLNTGISYRLL